MINKIQYYFLHHKNTLSHILGFISMIMYLITILILDYALDYWSIAFLSLTISFIIAGYAIKIHEFSQPVHHYTDFTEHNNGN